MSGVRLDPAMTVGRRHVMLFVGWYKRLKWQRDLGIEGAAMPAAPATLHMSAEREFLVSALGDFVRLAPEVNAMAVIPQHATYVAALHVAVHAGLPGINLG